MNNKLDDYIFALLSQNMGEFYSSVEISRIYNAERLTGEPVIRQSTVTDACNKLIGQNRIMQTSDGGRTRFYVENQSQMLARTQHLIKRDRQAAIMRSTYKPDQAMLYALERAADARNGVKNNEERDQNERLKSS